MFDNKPTRLLVALMLALTLSMPAPALACCKGEGGGTLAVACDCCRPQPAEQAESCCCCTADATLSAHVTQTAAPHDDAAQGVHGSPADPPRGAPCCPDCPCVSPGPGVTLTLPLATAFFKITPQASPAALPAAESLPLLLLPGGIFRPPRA